MTTNIKDYSTTQSSNTSLNGISVAEGMLPSNLNNAIRALMKNTRDWFNDAQWVEYGDGSGAYTAAYASATSFTIAGADVTSVYHAGRRIRLIATTPGTIFGTISSSSFSTNTTVNITWDSGSLSNETIDNVYIGILSKTNNSIPEGIIETATLADGSVTTAKIAADAVNGDKIADDSIDSEHYVDGSIDTVHIADSQITTAKIADTAVTTAKITDANVTLAKLATDSVNSSKIVDGSIVNADINASAAIDASKIADGSVSSTEFQYIGGLTSDAQTQLDAKLVKSNNLSDVTNASTARTNLGLTIGTDVQAYDAQLADVAGLTPTDSNFIVGDGSNFTTETGATARTSLGLGTIATQDANSVTLTGGSITGLSTPSSNSDAATKQYVDNLLAGIRTRESVAAGTTANIDLTADLQNGDTLDGVTLATDDNVLVKNQTTAAENGIYTVVASGTASRATEFDTFDEIAGALISVQEGTTNGDKLFLCTANFGGTLGVTDIDYQQQNVTTLDLVQDTTPQLGGNLDVNGRSIVSVSDGNITLTPNGTGKTVINSGQLGGNLDVSTNQIVSTSNNNVKVYPDGTGVLEVGGDGSSEVGKIQLNCEQNSHGVKIASPPHSAGQSYTLTLPSSITNDYYLKTDGSGNLSFAAVPTETKPTVADVSQTIAPDTATTINITGTNFVTIPIVDFINASTGATTRANTVSFTNATTLSVNLTLASGNYFVRIENPDGNAGRSTNNIITASTAPSFSTAAGSLGTIAAGSSVSLSVAASSDSNVTITETTAVLTSNANTPAGTMNLTLSGTPATSATYNITGTAPTPTGDQTYNFTLRATDVEGQTADRAFSITITTAINNSGQFN